MSGFAYESEVLHFVEHVKVLLKWESLPSYFLFLFFYYYLHNAQAVSDTFETVSLKIKHSR